MISFDRRFIFVHISRTGGSSLERLAGIDVSADSHTGALGNTSFPEKHKKFSYFAQRYPGEFESFFKFTIIRNPYDRLVSAWLWRCTVVKDRDCTLKEFIAERRYGWSYQAKLKLDHLSFDASVKELDFVGRFETLRDDIRLICERVGLNFAEFPHTNKTIRRPYWEYFDDESERLFTETYRDEIEYFGYEFGKDAATG